MKTLEVKLLCECACSISYLSYMFGLENIKWHNIASHQSWWRNRSTNNNFSFLLLEFHIDIILCMACIRQWSVVILTHIFTLCLSLLYTKLRTNDILRNGNTFTLCNRHKNWIKAYLSNTTATTTTTKPTNNIKVNNFCHICLLLKTFFCSSFSYYHRHHHSFND